MDLRLLVEDGVSFSLPSDMIRALAGVCSFLLLFSRFFRDVLVIRGVASLGGSGKSAPFSADAGEEAAGAVFWSLFCIARRGLVDV